MATIKSYTDIKQSRKLAEILPLESADMSWILVNYGDEAGSRHEPSLATYKTGSFFRDRIFPKDHTIPCWSLAALLEVLPYPYIEQNHKGKWLCRVEHENTTYIWEDSNPVDACYEMILKLYELKMLNL